MKSDVVVYVHTINWYWWKFGILFENSSDQLWEKGCSSDQEKLLKIRGWSPRIWRYFETTKTIYSNSERSKEFFETELFSNLLLESSIHICKVYIFWEGHKFSQNLHRIFVLSNGQIYGGISQNFVAFSEYKNFTRKQLKCHLEQIIGM